MDIAAIDKNQNPTLLKNYQKFYQRKNIHINNTRIENKYNMNKKKMG